MDAINAEVIGPSGPVYLDFDLGPDGGRGYFQPDEIGMHELFVTNEGEAVKGSPHYLRSMPKSKKDYDGKFPTKGLSKILLSATYFLDTRATSHVVDKKCNVAERLGGFAYQLLDKVS